MESLWEHEEWNDEQESMTYDGPVVLTGKTAGLHPAIESSTLSRSTDMLPLKLWLTIQEHTHVCRVLDSVNGNRREAARVLGISVRALYYKLTAYKEHNLRVAGA